MPDLKSRVAAWTRPVLEPTPVSMRRLALAGVVADTVIMSTGAAVRLSASGLGCPDWPQCSAADVVASKNAGQTLLNTWIEFGNRLLNFPLVIIAVLIFVAAWRFRPDGPTASGTGRRRDLVRLAAAQPLGVLAQAVKAKRKGAYEQALKPVHQRVGAALQVAKRFMRPERKFAIQSAVEVLRTAQSEYEGAMQNGAFTKPVEYQDSRGFVWRAERVIEETARAGPKPLDADSLAKVRATFAKLKAAWPAPVPPPKPLLEVGQISALISEIELYTSPITR